MIIPNIRKNTSHVPVTTNQFQNVMKSLLEDIIVFSYQVRYKHPESISTGTRGLLRSILQTKNHAAAVKISDHAADDPAATENDSQKHG